MFGGGAKKDKKDDEEDRGENSGSAKAQRDAAAAAKEGDEVSNGPYPVVGNRCGTRTIRILLLWLRPYR